MQSTDRDTHIAILRPRMMKTLFSAVFAAICASTLVSCVASDPAPAECLPGRVPTLEVGIGEQGFQTMNDGRLQLVHGIQGGYHTTVALESTYLAAMDAPVRVRVSGSIQGQELARIDGDIKLICNPETDTLQAWGLRLIWHSRPEMLHDKVAHIVAEIADQDDVTATATLQATIHDPLRTAEAMATR